MTLEDRDTCRSMLPEWFPQEHFEKPWDAFIELINTYVQVSQTMEDMEEKDPRKAWGEMEYHDSSSEWRTVERQGGWWKCRIGSEASQPGVPVVERNCPVRHKREADADGLQRRRNESLADTKKSMDDWIQKYMAKAMEKDKAYVLALIATSVDGTNSRSSYPVVTNTNERSLLP